ncbi:MAG: DUF190 domain-containing protein [Parachlamydiales bacterium]|jgi:hypothetical protein
MKKELEALQLRIFIGESDEYQGKKLYKYLLEMFREEGLSGATVLRGLGGFGKTSRLHTSDILRLSTDLPIIVEVTDRKEKIERIKPKLDLVMKEGLITEEKVKIIFYGGVEKNSNG